MHFIDTHTHLYSDELKADLDSLLDKAVKGGIKKFYMPNIDAASIAPMLEVEKKYPDACVAMMGLHPCSVKADYEEELAVVKSWLDKRPFAGVGEIGIDLYWDKTFLKEQQIAFVRQIEWALALNYPIVIHCREAFEEIYEILKGFKTLPKGIFHCFSGNLEQAGRILALTPFKLGIGGVLTFKNAGLDKVVETIGLENLVLETDAPYLAPVPFRGKRNEPAHMLEVARKLAEIKDLSMAEIGSITSKNAEYIFQNS